LSARVLISQISDLHIKPPGELVYGKVDTTAALERCIHELNRCNPRPDFVAVTGDLVDTPSKRAYDHVGRLLARLEIPFAVVPGNHDDRTMTREALPDTFYAPASGALNSAREVGDADVIMLDSSVSGSPYGELDAKTLAWLDRILGIAPSRPALLFLHHPPFITGIAHMDVQNLRNADDLAGILNRHPRVRLVAAGHVHRAVLTTFAGIAATICPAPNHAVALDLDGHLPSSFSIEPPAFHLHAWFPNDGFGSVVTHWVPIGDFDGPHPFFGGEGKLL
jgi:3',5'-cyclic-AMP phosphodiesterase